MRQAKVIQQREAVEVCFRQLAAGYLAHAVQDEAERALADAGGVADQDRR